MAGASDIVRSFAWLAVVAFLVGFVSYLALGAPAAAGTQDALQPAAYEAVGSGPLSDEWHMARRI